MIDRSSASSMCVPLAMSAAILSFFLIAARPAQAQRLPGTVRPENYTLTLTPDLKSATFAAVESIDVTVEKPVGSITLNAAEISFQTVTVTAAGKQQTATVSLDNQKQQATFTFPEQVAPGKATLAIAYTGILNGELRGFYLSKTARRNYAVTPIRVDGRPPRLPFF